MLAGAICEHKFNSKDEYEYDKDSNNNFLDNSPSFVEFNLGLWAGILERVLGEVDSMLGLKGLYFGDGDIGQFRHS